MELILIQRNDLKVWGRGGKENENVGVNVAARYMTEGITYKGGRQAAVRRLVLPTNAAAKRCPASRPSEFGTRKIVFHLPTNGVDTQAKKN